MTVTRNCEGTEVKYIDKPTRSQILAKFQDTKRYCAANPTANNAFLWTLSGGSTTGTCADFIEGVCDKDNSEKICTLSD